MGFIADLRQAGYAKLQALQVANPTVLGQVSRARPASLSLGAVHAYVGDLRPNMRFTNQLRQWDGTELDIVLVAAAADNVETQDTLDDAADIVLDAFSADHHFAGVNMTGQPTRVRAATELESNGIGYPAVVVTIGAISYLEGGY